MHPRSPHRRRAVGTALVLAAATAAACSTGASEVATPTSTTSTTGTAAPDVEPATTATTTAVAPDTTETTAANPEQQVLAAYQAFWDTWLEANDPPNPDHPGLRRYYTGPALEKALSEIQKNKNAGVRLQLPENSKFGFSRPSIQLFGASAVLRTCLVDDGAVVLGSTGAVADASVVNSDIEAHLVRTSEGWVVSENRYLAKRPGATCV